MEAKEAEFSTSIETVCLHPIISIVSYSVTPQIRDLRGQIEDCQWHVVWINWHWRRDPVNVNLSDVQSARDEGVLMD